MRNADSQVLIAADILQRSDFTSASSGFREEVLSAVRALDKSKVEHTLNSFVDMLKENLTDQDTIIAHLSCIGLYALEYAAEQGIAPQENICMIICEQPNLDSAYEKLVQYIFEMIDETDKRISRQVKQCKFIIEYVNRNYMDSKLSAKSVQSLLPVSSSYFNMIVKDYTGDTFVNFLSKLRVEKAGELMLTTDKMNYEIAAEVGYECPGYFSRVFKKYAGFTPTEFRKLKGNY